MKLSFRSHNIRAADVAEITEVAKVALAGHAPSDSTWRDIWSDGGSHVLKPPRPGRRIPPIKILTAPLVGLRSTIACGGAVRSIEHIAAPIINLGNRPARKDESNPKRHFKNHVSGPAIRPTMQRKSSRLTKISDCFNRPWSQPADVERAFQSETDGYSVLVRGPSMNQPRGNFRVPNLIDAIDRCRIPLCSRHNLNFDCGKIRDD
jgi:hypothetical protein